MARRSTSLAVIGCGWAGTRHARAFADLGAEVRWAVDTEPARAQVVATEVGSAQTTTDYRDALADPALDAVAICLPHHLHAPVAIAAAEFRKHVLCEKPLAGTLEDADRMIAAAADARVVLMVAENVRFTPLLLTVRDLLQDGAIGRAVMIRMTREGNLTRSLREERPWFLDAHAAAGGIMMSGGIHDIEAMRMLMGQVSRVYAVRAPQRFTEMEGDDTSVALLQFHDGAVGTLVESFVARRPETAAGQEVRTLQIDGDLGSIAVDDGATIRLFSERQDPRTGAAVTQQEISIPPQDTFALEAQHFLECIRTGTEPVTSGRSQRAPLAIVLAAYRSMMTTQPVRIAAS